MNRRVALTALSAAAAVAFASYSTQAEAQQSADVEGVKAAVKAFYAALAVLDNGEAMEKVWAQKPYVRFVGPRSKSIVVGPDALKKYWPEANKLFVERNVSLVDEQIHVVGNLAWVMGHETGQTKLKDGGGGKVDNFSTGVYEKIDGRWLKISHHAQPRPK